MCKIIAHRYACSHQLNIVLSRCLGRKLKLSNPCVARCKSYMGKPDYILNFSKACGPCEYDTANENLQWSTELEKAERQQEEIRLSLKDKYNVGWGEEMSDDIVTDWNERVLIHDLARSIQQIRDRLEQGKWFLRRQFPQIYSYRYVKPIPQRCITASPLRNEWMTSEANEINRKAWERSKSCKGKIIKEIFGLVADQGTES